MGRRGANFRGRRLESDILRFLSEMIGKEVKDERLRKAGCVVQQVQLSVDLAYAKVYVSFIQPQLGEKAREVCLSILDQSAGYFRSRIGRKFAIRTAPELSFYYDETADEMARIEKDLEEERRELQRIRQNAPDAGPDSHEVD